MIATGRCVICGRKIGLKPVEIGVVPPPTHCATCKGRTLEFNSLFGTLQGIATGKEKDGAKCQK